MPPDDYPARWTPWLTHDEPPSKPDGRHVGSLRSGAHTDSGDRYTTTQPYPQGWGWNTHGVTHAPAGPIDEAMRAAASVLVVHDDD